MNISYNWLKRYIATDLPAEKIAEILTDIGLEVEGFEKIETVKGGLRGVVVGEVVTCADHPDSDHLHVTAVDVGAAEPLQIVCGAANCRAGLKVLCATVGAVLYPDGGDEEFKIKRSKIRGVESLGMLCAEDELGIGSSHDGIMELPADAPVGMEAREYLHVEDDYLIEIGLTPNRVDAASHIGVARDLAAYLKSRGENAEVKLPDVSAFAPDNHDLEVAVSGNLHAMFVLKYVGGRNVARGLAVLQKENIRLMVTCQDPSLTATHITEVYRLPEGMVTVLDQEQCDAIKAAPADPADVCCMIHLKGFASLTGGLQAADQAQNAENSATTVQMVSVLFSIVIAALLTSAGSIWELSVATVLMYQAAWSALSIAVCALKQHN